ncbi:MAG: class I SAM-dependent methyltransferase [Phycisphaeraceae bacterium]
MTTRAIPTPEVTFHTSVSPVHTARLFEWRGDLYRAVRQDHAATTQALFTSGVAQQLMDQGKLVCSQVTPLQLPGYPLVLLHERLSPITYPFEWSAAAFKDAALLWLDLNLELAAHHLCVVDAHPWNTLFDGARPVFVDFGSFVPLASTDPVNLLDAYARWFIHPLKLMAAGHHRIARALLQDLTRPISDQEMTAMQGRSGWLHQRMQRIRQRVAGHRRRPWGEALRQLRDQVQGITLSHDRSDWSDYYGPDFPSLQAPQTWTPKQRAISDILHRLAPNTVHDVAGNRGWYSQLAAHSGAKVICSDVDECCLDAVYSDARKQGLAITPVRLDLRQPSPALGWGGTRFPGASARLKSDCVLALAVMHHMVFRAMADFPTVLDGLSALTRHDLVVEFVSPQDRFVSQWWTPAYDWYTLANLREEACRRYHAVDVVPSFPDGRHLMICQGLRQTNRNIHGLAA